MKRRSVTIKILTLLALLLVCILAFGGCKSQNVIKRLKNRYNVDTQLLDGYKIVCDIEGETFGGRAPRYAAVALKSEPTAFLQSFTKFNSDGFSSQKNQELKNQIDAHSCLKIPQGSYPDWDADYYWIKIGEEYDGNYDALYTIYFPDEYKLVFFETGH